jgi:hypothetical protein
MSDNDIEVELTWGEVYRAGEAALQRSVANKKLGRKDAYGAEKDEGLGLDKNWLGCLGEMAVAKHFNVYWHATEFGVTDVGGFFEVRAVASESRRLCGHDKDPDNLPFILARVTALPSIRLVGWLHGCDIKQKEWFGEANPEKPNGRPAYWVPNARLRSMQELRF